MSPEFHGDEFAGDINRDSIAEGQGLRSPESRLARRRWSGHHANFAKTIQHHEGCSDIAQPPKRRQSYKSIVRYADETLESVLYARQTKLGALGSDAILDLEMTSLHRDADAIAVEGENAGL